ncbi:uncharacterized protein LOC133123168 [Conger conger]|uniref:uncharacterized protein LOC133123168 n=1 Tax=Conger conger TaxID=82655 RepID=UPI002A59DAE3|nr:uncharacterized protein LOC133123168 [Conger conger]
MNEGSQDVELQYPRGPSIEMYLCICGVLLTLGLILFFSYYGLFIIEFVPQKLCLCHEKSTQTDLSQEKMPSQKRGSPDQIDAINKKLEEPELSHEVVLRCPNVKKSLQQVFECAYSQYILTWYNVPGPRNKQPLYIALKRQFDTLVDRVIRRASDINFSSIAVDSVRILTQHLHNAKQPKIRGQLFSSTTDEIAVLRVFSEALVRNFFPESLTTQDLTRCALNEIVTLKVLQLLVEWLSDPDNLNQLMVSYLDPMTPKNSTDEVQGPQGDDAPSSLGSEAKEAIREGTEDANVKPKKKGVQKLFWK